jgi:hypothetical protein
MRAETNLVWLASWFRTNYRQHHLRPVDLALHRRLRKPIAKALYPLLESGWYATSGQPFTKSYQDLCQEFLLTPYPQLSRIKEQFDPAHQDLARERVLAQWDYRPAATGKGWILIYAPGAKYFEDQRARAARRDRSVHSGRREPAPPPVMLAPTGPAVAPVSAATRVVQYFYQRFHGVAAAAPPTRALRQAEALIAEHGEALAQFVVDIAHRDAQKTQYHPSHFGGILGYVPGALQAYAQRQLRTAQEQEDAQAAQLRTAYDAFVQQALARYKAAMSSEELTALKAAVQGQVTADRTIPPFARAMEVRLRTDATLLAQAGIPAFDTWHQTQGVRP